MPDLIDEIFSDDNYPGSKRKRRDVTPAQNIADPEWRDEYAVTKMINGKEVRLYTIGALASALHVTVPTIRKWTRKGNIPQAPYRLPSTMKVQGENVAGRRLYTAEIIDATVEIFERYGVLDTQRIVFDQHPGLSMDIIDAWSRILERARNTE